MIYVIGEILMDIYEQDDQVSYFIGGAPFNVACTIEKLGGHVSFYGRVGDDVSGEKLLDFARRKEFKELNIVVDSKRKTTTARVGLDEKGERTFIFERNNTADYFFEEDNFDLNKLLKYRICHFGSLMINHQPAMDFLIKAMKFLKKNKILISFDVNYRDDLFIDGNEAKSKFLKLISMADIIKFSMSEVELLGEGRNFEEKLNSLVTSKQMAFVSKGHIGSSLYYDKKVYNVNGIKVKAVDTTGAGDIFYGSILYHLNKKRTNYEAMLLFANIAAGLSVTKKGAIDSIPSKKEIEEILKK